ncbi:tetratricopeptide repeat protein [Desulfonatronospira sp. MSAO_Bac3]|uniref:tetratricopeptide repeat protein n=1 Tax=Desulfonatronospira sp. MSAO_Bac3 TaxID=2293857 RepID=UPI000FF3C1D6|nr:tetratricopeptide repeat protein [Desulfonatronospira sp. MSAO_Bac3]RQD79581.1 MAG: tetratricopeptide repeat protein [Desulfonatronospira sp. MSAO_Bac3]
MYNLSQLTGKLTEPEKTEMVAQGYAAWMTWSQELPDSIPETLQSFGGWEVAREGQQSLWMFPSQDVLHACAQMYRWYLNAGVQVHIRVFTAKLNFGPDMSYSLGLEERIRSLSVEYPRDLEIWVHAKVKENIVPRPGIKLEQAASSFLPEEKQWYYFRATEQAVFTPSFSWLFIVRPAALESEAEQDEAWNRQKTVLQEMCARMGFETFAGHRDHFVVRVDGIRQLKNWSLELLAIFSGRDKHLSCYLLGLDNPGINPAEGIPDRLMPDLKQMEPDCLYLPLKNILQMGRALEILPDARSSQDKKISDLFRAGLGPAYKEELQARLPVCLPAGLTRGGFATCFYCGLKNHAPGDCPTRQIFNLDYALEQLARVDVHEINQALESLGSEVSSSVSWDELLRGSSPSRLVMRAIMGINYPAQHRTFRLMRRSRGREWPDGLKQLTDPQEDSRWGVMENLRMKQTGFVRNSLNRLCLKHPKDFRPRTMLGFLALEENDFKAARGYWEEAARLGYTPMQQAYHHYLLARLAETGQDFSRAFSLYQQAQKNSPGMLEARYRQGVCLVKNGDVDQAMSIFLELCRDTPEIFNQVLIDPELAQGHQHLMISLYSSWRERRKKARSAEETLQNLNRKARAWFPEGHPLHDGFQTRIQGLEGLTSKENYAAFVRMEQGVKELQRDLEKAVGKEVHEVKKRFARLESDLKDITSRLEAIPLKSIAAGKVYRLLNESRSLLENVRGLNTSTPHGYRQARDELDQAGKCAQLMQKRLRSLRLFRDGVLFLYFMTRSFFWILLGVLLASTLIVGLGTYVGLRREMEWAFSILEQRRSLLQLGIMLVAMLSLALAAIRTTMVFERLKSRYLEGGK